MVLSFGRPQATLSHVDGRRLRQGFWLVVKENPSAVRLQEELDGLAGQSAKLLTVVRSARSSPSSRFSIPLGSIHGAPRGQTRLRSRTPQLFLPTQKFQHMAVSHVQR